MPEPALQPTLVLFSHSSFSYSRERISELALPCEHLLRKRQQGLKGLFLELDLAAVAQQIFHREVHLEVLKTNHASRWGQLFHRHPGGQVGRSS